MITSHVNDGITVAPTFSSDAIFPPVLYEAALQALRTFDLKHGKRTLYEHLVGTAQILCAWRQPEHVVVAGLFHSIYSTPSYRTQAVSYDRRKEIEAILGSESEQLVYLFSLLKPQDVEQALREVDGTDTDRLVTVRTEARSGRAAMEIVLPLRMLHDLEVIHLANTIDQASDSHQGPGFCLAPIAKGVAMLPATRFPLPETRLVLLQPLSYHQELHLLDAYEDLVGAFGMQHDWSTALQRCIAFAPEVAELRFWQALHHDLNGNVDEARLLARQAYSAFELRGSAWDKRLSGDEWLATITALKTGPLGNTRLDGLRGVFAPRAAEAEATTGIGRFYRYLVHTTEDGHSRPAGWYPGLADKPFHDKEQFSITHTLENNFETIREEVLRLEQSSFHSEAENIGRTGRWEVFILFESGRMREENCARVPELTQILQQSPDVRTSAGLIYLSRVKANTSIAAHRGGSNLRIRLHLGIIIPEGDCKLRVDNEITGWTAGKCIVFDDFYEHEVWNNTEEDRLVLVVDLWHPDLSAVERRALEAMNVTVARQARGRLRYWETNERQKMREESAGKDTPTNA